MAKNIVLLSDGTGNSSAKLFRTNVWRLYEALDLGDPTRQIAYYDDGVGTSSFKPFAVLGGIFGFGLKRNVIGLYSFLCRNYAAGDRIFGFGFSRGAFTIRVLMGMIAAHGVVPYNGDEAQLARDARDVYRKNRARFGNDFLVPLFRAVRDAAVSLWRGLKGHKSHDPVPVDTIHFLGLWDTVEAYGGPLEELTRAIDYYVWPLSMPDRYMSGKIQRACHALALDDERQAFWPVLWDSTEVGGPNGRIEMDQKWSQAPDGESAVAPWMPPAGQIPAIDRQRLSQVWFTGMHSDVGGGYPQDGLSHVALDWMMDRGSVYGLAIRPTERARLSALSNKFDKLNDSRHGLGGYYRYKPRKLADIYAADPVRLTLKRDLRHVRDAVREMTSREPASHSTSLPPMIHESVLERIKAGTDGYSPIVLPQDYCVTDKSGQIATGRYEHTTQAAKRAHQQEYAWNRVWGRRVVYFITLAVSLFIATLPFSAKSLPHLGPVSPAEIVIPLVNAVGHLLPGFASFWLDAFKQAPGYLLVSGVLLVFLLSWGGSLQQGVFDKMRQLWRPVMASGPQAVVASQPISSRLYRVRSHKIYRGIFYAWLHWVGPLLFAIIIYLTLLYLLVVVVTRVLFPTAMALGFVCTPASQPSAGTITFDTRSLCQGTGYSVVEGRTYSMTLNIPEPWRDGYRYGKPETNGIETGPEGFGWDRTTKTMILGLPLRRLVSENWFRLIVRVGSRGLDEQAVTIEPPEVNCECPPPKRTTFKVTFTARKSGEVFLYVNDSVYGLPWIADCFYRNNFGTATVKIEELR